MSLYVIASSDKSKNYYPYNQPYHFKSFIKQPLELEGHWRGALTEIDFDKKITVHSPNVECNICEGAVVNGVTSNVLRKVNTDLRRTFTNNFNWLYYVPVIVSGIREIEITTKEASGALATFFSQPVVVTLHFSKI